MMSEFQKSQQAKKPDWMLISTTVVVTVTCFYLALRAVA